MDPSTRLRFVTGDLRARASEFDTSEWAVILSHALKICTPNLKYSTGFRPLGTFKKGQYIGDHSPTVHAEDHSDLTDDLECMELMHLTKECFGELKEPIGGGASVNHGPAVIIETKLLLSRTGKWIFFSVHQGRSLNAGRGSVAVAVTGTAVTLKLVGNGDCAKLVLNANKHFGMIALLKKLKELLGSMIIDRRNVLCRLECKHGELEGLIGRIDMK